MKRGILLLPCLLVAIVSMAQTEVTTGVMRGKDYGITYMLPKTEIEIVLQATKHTYTPGEFCKYADRYLRLGRVSPEAKEYWTLDNVEMHVVGVPDKDNVYFVKMKDRSSAPLMELTEDGIVRSINMPFSGIKAKEQNTSRSLTNRQGQEELDPRSFMTEEILTANSSAKMAELVAKEIYSIRESKNALIRGEADNTPKDGVQLKLMIDNLNAQERAMTEMFAGKTRQESKTYTFRLTPKESKDEVAFRFSQALGVLPSENLAGSPYYISIENLEVPDLSTEVEDEKKKLEGIVYNVPGRAKVTLSQGNKVLYDVELPVTQFGTTEYLAPVLFNKNSTTQVSFDINTGGILKVDRGE